MKFLESLGTVVQLKQLKMYSGGLDTRNDSDGEFSVAWADDFLQVMFHVATMMTGCEPLDKKRHIGNDFVHVVYLVRQ